MRIALFVTCLGDTLYPSVGQATVRLLERLGHQVVFPGGQTCCGQMHINTGYQKDAVGLIHHHVEVFSPYEAIVVPSGSCVGAIRHQHAMVARRAGQPSLAAAAEAVAGRTYELSEFLVDVLGVEDVGASYPHRSPTTRPVIPSGCCTWRTNRCACCAASGASTWWSCRMPISAAASEGPSP
jgi:L-lactate dehydrogenase complex protein LldE